jgi:hypothetical protein
MYGHSPIGDLILYMDNCLTSEIFIFIETIGLNVRSYARALPYYYIKYGHYK